MGKSPCQISIPHCIIGLMLEMPTAEIPKLFPCPDSPVPLGVLSEIPYRNATRDTKLSPNIIGDPWMQMATLRWEWW